MTRDFYFDNLKSLLIFLVVLGHFVYPVPLHGAHVIEYYIYIFHMPLFIFISGYFSRNSTIIGSIKKVFIPFLILQLVHYMFNNYIINKEAGLEIFNPAWSLWYLLSLFFWRLSVPILRKLKAYWIVIISIVAGLLCGYDQSIGLFMSLSRTIVYFPFFLLGFYFNKDIILKYKKKFLLKNLSILILVISVVYVYFNIYDLNHSLQMARSPYSKMGLEYPELGWVYRLIYYLTTIIISWCIMILTPSKKYFFSYLGETTMSVYILHAFIYWIMLKFFNLQAHITSKHDLILLISTTLILTLILGAPNINKLLSPIYKIPIEYLFKGPAPRK